MPMDTVSQVTPTTRGLAPFSLRDAPALIERVFPAQKVGIEAQKERKAGAGQTLTALGSYWKGRKPLVLVRACVLASLLPATDDPVTDLEVFEALMAMDRQAMPRRGPKVTAEHVMGCPDITALDKTAHLSRAVPRPGAKADGDDPNGPIAAKWRPIGLSYIADKADRAAERKRIEGERDRLRHRALLSMPFSQQVAICERVEKVEDIRSADDPLYAGIWDRVNDHLGTAASTLPELVEQLGIARFGQRPVVGDPFCGGGSIPFEAARVGCDVVASDLNPVAAMLTWGALNIIGADEETRVEIAEEQKRVASEVDAEITRLGIEHNARGDRAKAYLYCLETLDPQTGWLVPMAPSWVISRNRRCVAQLVPDYGRKRFDIIVKEDATAAEMAAGEKGTVRDGHLIYKLAPLQGSESIEWRAAISRLRGDGDGPTLPGGTRGNRLRQWEIDDFEPRRPDWVADAPPVVPGATPGAWGEGDIWLERLYCIQWMDGTDIAAGRSRPRSFFAAPEVEDLQREIKVSDLVRENLDMWQTQGIVPDMRIELGAETTRLIRERGWTHWNHLFTPRQLILAATTKKGVASTANAGAAAALCFDLSFLVDRSARLSRWRMGFPGSSTTAPSADAVENVFYNQALNTLFVYGAKSLFMLQPGEGEAFASFPLETSTHVSTCAVEQGTKGSDLWVYDPPYADAVHYHEITEFFIAWLRMGPPSPFNQYTWDSRRPLAIQGKGEKFRADMVAALRAMADRMPDNGLQVCMFTHQDAGVWADMAQIVWGAGLRVTAAWYVSTETTSDLKKGGYVQGTVLLVLRKRQGDERAYKDELVLEVRGAVQRQVDLLTGLNQRAKARQRDENPFSDADVQMAGYAAALEVLTGYTHIEGVDMTREALRPRVKGQTGIVEDMIALAVQTATELMRPEGLDESMWERLVPTERFWLKMAEAEANRPPGQPAGKLDDYQNFAKAYRADGWDDLMADSTPNKARLKGAADFKRGMMTGHPFAAGLVRPVLYAVNELRAAAERDEDHNASAERAISGLRDNLASWAQQRQQAMVLADWMGRMLDRHRPTEASAARTLAALIRTERLG